MRILFCKTGYMKYYKGINANDKLYNGGEYTKTDGETRTPPIISYISKRLIRQRKTIQ